MIRPEKELLWRQEDTIRKGGSSFGGAEIVPSIHSSCPISVVKQAGTSGQDTTNGLWLLRIRHVRHTPCLTPHSTMTYMMTCTTGVMLAAAATAAAVFSLAHAFESESTSVHSSKTMNDGLYTISNANPASSARYDTRYSGKEFFEVYSPLIRTAYGEVYWRMMDEVPLPQDIVDRFDGRVMAVVGYEVDQVRTDTSTDDSGDVPVPITHAYNHHYGAWISNSRKVRMVKKKRDQSDKKLGGMMMDHGSDEYWTAEPMTIEEEGAIPLSQFFSEANGGEMRLSYHGYPSSYAQLLDSPNVFHIQPMQIDTWNRDEPTAAFRPGGPLPKSSSQIPPSAGYSGLIECPCSDRLEKKTWPTYQLCERSDDTIRNATECLAAAKTVAQGSHYSLKVVNDASQPSGCTLTQKIDGDIEVLWNTHTPTQLPPTDVSRITEEVGVGAGKEQQTVAFASGQVNVTVTSLGSDDSDYVGITIIGPSDAWFAVGFGSNTMCLNPVADECPSGGPYAIIVDAKGNVFEHKLDFHGPGKLLEPSIQIETVTEKNGYLKIALKRPLQGLSENHYTFDVDVGNTVPIITARGCPETPDFPHQHCGHGPSHLTFLPVGESLALCFKEVVGSIGGNMFSKDLFTVSPERSNRPR